MVKFSLNEIFTLLMGNVMALGFVDGIKSVVKTTMPNDNAGIESWIIGIAVGVLVMAYVLPMAFNAFYTADATKFCRTIVNADGTFGKQADSATISLWYLVPVLIIVGIIIFFATNKHH